MAKYDIKFFSGRFPVRAYRAVTQGLADRSITIEGDISVEEVQEAAKGLLVPMYERRREEMEADGLLMADGVSNAFIFEDGVLVRSVDGFMEGQGEPIYTVREPEDVTFSPMFGSPGAMQGSTGRSR